MDKLVTAWQGNHDIQHEFAEPCKKAKDGNMKLKWIVCHMANKFINDVESPVMGACNHILQLSITQSSLKRMSSECVELISINSKDKETCTSILKIFNYLVALQNISQDQKH